MDLRTQVEGILKDAAGERPIAQSEAELLLALPEDSLEAALLRATANAVSRRRFGNVALLLGQIGVDMAPCEGDCAFCFFAWSHTTVQRSVLSDDEIVARCQRFAAGGAQCRQHGAMQRFPVPGSPLYKHGQISLPRLAQIVAVIALATIGKKELKSIAVNVSNLVGLFSGANAFFPEAGEPERQQPAFAGTKEGFTTALWRPSNEITTADCRKLIDAGFSSLMGTDGTPSEPLRATADMRP